MRATKRPEPTRLNDLANQWCRHGCPEKMTIHVKSTGETIVLINGLPLEPTVKTTESRCSVCSRPLPQGREKYCSRTCSSRSAEETRRKRKEQRAEEAVAVLRA